MFVDVEELLIAYLQPVSPGRVAGEMPAAPVTPFGAPFLVVARVAGGDDRVTEAAVVDVQYFHNTRVLAGRAARQAHQMMENLTPSTLIALSTGVVAVDRVVTLHGPSFLAYHDENLRRYVARYEISSRITAQPLP